MFKVTGVKTCYQWEEANSFNMPSDCIYSSQGGQRYYMTDTTHGVVRMKWKSRNQGTNIFYQREPFFNGALFYTAAATNEPCFSPSTQRGLGSAWGRKGVVLRNKQQ